MLKLLTGLIILVFGLITTTSSQAADCTLTLSQNPVPPNFNGRFTLTSQEPCFQSTVEYTVLAVPQNQNSKPQDYFIYPNRRNVKPEPDNKTINFNLDLSRNILNQSIGRDNPGVWIIKVCKSNTITDCANNDNILAAATFQVSANLPTPTSTPRPTVPPEANQPLIRKENQIRCGYQIGEPVNLTVENVSGEVGYHGYWSDQNTYDVYRKAAPRSAGIPLEEATYNSTMFALIPGEETAKVSGRKTLCIDIGSKNRSGQNCIDLNFFVKPPTGNLTSCYYQVAPPVPSCAPGSPQCPSAAGVLCNPATGLAGTGGIMTAIGCVPTEPAALVQGLLKVSALAGGGIALLLMIAGAIQMMTSAGDQNKLQSGKEQFTNAIIGLLFIIFSILLLRIIGVDILQILK